MLLAILDVGSVEARRFRKRRRFDPKHSYEEVNRAWKETLFATDAEDPSLTCDHAIDALILRLPSAGSLLYALFNGWYLGQWADYTSCLTDATNSQYILATVSGDYKGALEFTRGGLGKFSPELTTRMGLCFPK